VGALVEGEHDPMKALSTYRLKLDAPPTLDDPPGERRDYYLRQPNTEPAIRNYYAARLLPFLVAEYRKRVGMQWPGWRPVHLVTILSGGSWELVPMEVGILQPRQCWLLYTRDFDRAEKIAEQIARINDVIDHLTVGLRFTCEIHAIPFENQDDLVLQSSSRLRGIDEPDSDDDPWAIDLTLGNVLMSLTLAEQARPLDRLIYWKHRISERRPVPGSQVLCSKMGGGTWELNVAGPVLP
jgi:hypothetical protein